MRRLNKSFPYQKQLKNRSSKDLSWMCGPGTKPIVRCVSTFLLKKWADVDLPGALAELNRRQKKSEQ